MGSLELQNMTEAEIGHSNALPFKYGEHNLSDGDILKVGDVKIKALVHARTYQRIPLLPRLFAQRATLRLKMVFTGDTLFAGSVGRTDLYGKTDQPHKQKNSTAAYTKKVLPLGDHVLVYPAHGAGSVCGHGISGQEPTTIGFEKKTNPYLQLGIEEFIKKVLARRIGGAKVL